MIELIASDVDGTLLQEGCREFSAELFPLIREMRKRGIYFAACSGRQYANLRNLFAPVADDIAYICENGNLVVWQGQIIEKQTIDRKRGQALLRAILAQPGCEALLSGVSTCYVQPKEQEYLVHVRDEVGNVTTVVPDICAVEEDFLKISLYCKSGVSAALGKNFSAFPPYLTPAIGRSTWIDFLRENCDKGTALEALYAHLGVKPENCIVYGDNENDLPVIGHAGMICAMANGHPLMRERADRTVEDVVTDLKALLS